MSAPPPGYNPEESLLQGGDAPIHPVMGGGGAVEGVDESAKTADIPTGQELARVMQIPTNVYGNPISVDEVHHVMATATPEEKEIAREAAILTQKRLEEDPPTVEEIAGIQGGGGTPLSRVEQENLVATAAIAAIIKKRRDAGEDTLPEEVQAAHEKVMGRVKKGPLKSAIQANTSPVTLQFLDITESNYQDTLSNIQPGNTGIYKRELKKRIEMYLLSQASKNWNELVYSDPSSQKVAPNRPVMKEMGGVDVNLFSKVVYILPIDTAEIVVVEPMNGDFIKFSKVYTTLKNSGILEENGRDPATVKKNTVLVFTPPFYGETDENNTSLLLAFLRIQSSSPRQMFVLSDPTSTGYTRSVRINKQHNITKILLTMLEPSYIVYPHKRGKADGILITHSSDILAAGLPPPSDPKLYTTLDSYLKSPRNQKTATIIYRTGTGESQVKGYYQIISNTANATKVARGEIIGGTHSQYGGKIARIQLSTNAEKIAGKDTLLFITSLEANDDPREVKQRTIELNGNYYDIRISDPYHNNVFDNWLRKMYTQDEANLLNEMNLRPYILTQIFSDWPKEVAMFLRNLGLSNCFTDESIMTRRECQTSRVFIRRVVEHYAIHGITNESIDAVERQAFDEQEAIVEKQINAELNNTAPKALNEEGMGIASKEELKNSKKHTYVTNIASNQHFYIMTIINQKTNRAQIRKFAFDIQLTEEDAQKYIDTKLNELRAKNPDYIFL